MMVSFVLSFFPRDVLDEILNLIESVSEDFPSYSCAIFGSLRWMICDFTRFKSILLISRLWKGDNERLCATGLRLERPPPPADLEPRIVKLASQRLPTELPGLLLHSAKTHFGQ